MTFLENPFYILGASPLDSRKKLAELADRKSLLLGSEKASEAYRILTNPQKRLAAELRWFPGCTDGEIGLLVHYVEARLAGEPAEDPDPESMAALPELCVWLGVLPVMSVDDAEDTSHSILNISKALAEADRDGALREINKARAEAGFPPAEQTGQLEEELAALRGELRAGIMRRLEGQSEDTFVKTVGEVARAGIGGGTTCGPLVNDLLDDYAVKMAEKLRFRKEKAIKAEAEVRARAGTEGTEEAVKALERALGEWYELAGPLQKLALHRGTRYPDGEELARSVRSLAIELHNQYGRSDLSLVLIQNFQRVFDELPGAAELALKDIEFLMRQPGAQEQTRRQQEESDGCVDRQDKKYSVTVTGSSVSVPPYCTCCMKPTTDAVRVIGRKQTFFYRTTRSQFMPICPECFAHGKKMGKLKWAVVSLTILASVVCAAFFQFRFKVDALIPCAVITFLFYQLFGSLMRVSPLGPAHTAKEHSAQIGGFSKEKTTYIFTNRRYARMFADANHVPVTEANGRNTADAKSWIKSTDQPYYMLLLTVLAVLGIVSFMIDLQPSAAPASVNPGSSPASPVSATADEQTKQARLQAIAAELDTRGQKIDEMNSELDGMESKLTYYEQQYNLAQGEDKNRWANYYHDLADTYNTLYDTCSAEIKAYNKLVDEYKALQAS